MLPFFVNNFSVNKKAFMVNPMQSFEFPIVKLYFFVEGVQFLLVFAVRGEAQLLNAPHKHGLTLAANFFLFHLFLNTFLALL